MTSPPVGEQLVSDVISLKVFISAISISTIQTYSPIQLYFTAAYTLLVYDYFLTLPAEIEFAWKNRKTMASILFFLNRYISLGFSTTIMTSYFLPSWTPSVCNRFSISEFIYTVLIFTIAEIFLALRVYVLTRKNIYLALIFILHVLAQLGLAFFIMSTGGTAAEIPIDGSKLLDPDSLQVCVLTPSYPIQKYYTVYLSFALSFDAFVFIATLISTFAAARQYRAKPWLRVIQRDGIIYFLAIFSSTLAWVILGQVARPGLRLVNAIPDLIFTSVMISRLYLQLKKAGAEEDQQHVGKYKGRRTDMELQVIVSQHITSVIL